MLKRSVSLLLLLAMLLSLLPVMSFEALGATYTTADWNALRNNWKVSICGDDTVDWSDPEIKNIVGKTNSSGVSTSGISYNGGKYWRDLESNRANSGRIFGSTNITITVSSDTMRKQFLYLTYMAKAYGTRGAVYTYKDTDGNLVTMDLYQCQELRDAIFYGLEKGTTIYNKTRWSDQKTSSTASSYYNWWDWAFGAPDEILQTLLIMYPFKTTAEKNTANKMIDAARYLIDTIRPNNDGKTDETTLSYRRTRLRICGMISALTEDVTLMEQTRTNLLNFLDQNDGGNGVQVDHSYVAHNCFAYEGCYGVQNLCERIIGSYFVMSGTAFELTSSKRSNQVDWIIRTFMPAMHNGVMMMQSNGRFPASGISYGRYAITAALQLLGCFDAEADLKLMQFIRLAVVRETEEETKRLYTDLAVDLGNVLLVSRLKDVVFNHNIPEDTGTYAQMRYGNDRAVQHTANYTVGLAMSSRRIATHESINGANRYGFYTGDGAVYVYNDTTDVTYDQYGSLYNRYANMYRVPGTTEENSTTRKPVSQKFAYYPGMTYTSSGWVQATNKDGVDAGAFVGGVELNGQYIAAAMDFEAYSWSSAESTVEKNHAKNAVERNNIKQVITSDLTAKKSYFMFDDEIVCVGSDIDFSTRSNSVYTYVDNRELLEKTTVDGVTTYGTDDIMVDGVLLEKVNSFTTKKYTDPKWVYAENFGGYVFPKGGNVTLKKAYRESSADGDDTNDSFNDYTLGASAQNGKHSFLEIWVDHGSKPVNGTYSYVMLPGMTAEETQGYSNSPDISIVKNTTSLHVVKENTLGITAMVFWKAGTYGDITVDKPMIVMVQEKDGMYTITASDPTQELTSGTITINRNLHTWDTDSKITVSGSTTKKTLKINFSGSRGRTFAAEFAIEAPQELMFDFAKVNSGKYSDSLYGYNNYADVSNWAPKRISASELSVSGGKLSFPLTTEKDSSGNPSQWMTYIQPSNSQSNFAWNSDYTTNNFLNFDASNAEIFQIRFKLEGAVQYGNYDAGVYLTYLPEGSKLWSGSSDTSNPWKESIKSTIPKECLKGGSLEGEYVTLTFDLSNKKISTCGTIKAVCFYFGYLREGKATVDYIYIGRKTESLYFGFGKDGSVFRYAEGAYGGHDYDDGSNPTWGVACADDAGNYYKLDPVAGTLTLYAGEDYYGSEGSEHYGAYLGTSASSGSYAFQSNIENHPLSYDPSQSEIVEVRFKTEGLGAQEGKNPQLVLMAVQEKDGVTSANSNSKIPIAITNGQWQTVQIPVIDSLKEADYLKSLGLRFQYTRNADPGDFATITVDYIYMGKKSDAPSNLYIGFTDTDSDRERYLSQTYGNVNMDAGGWKQSGRLSTPTFSSANGGTMSLKVNADADAGVLYVQSSPSINKPLCMEYDTTSAEVVQFRFKLKNFKTYDTAKVGLYFYSDISSHPMGSDSIKNAATELYYPSAEEINSNSYITVTYPVSSNLKAAEKVTALRLSVTGLQSISSTQIGEITVDYVYVGPRAFVPTGSATVTYTDDTGTVIGSQTFAKGEKHIYNGAVPTKDPTAECHYIFTGWDQELTEVTEDVTLTAQFKEETHTYTEGICSCGKVQNITSVEEVGWKLGHTLNLASDISVNMAVSKQLLEGYDIDTVYVETELDVYTGNVKTGTKTVKLFPEEQGNYYYFVLTGLTAVHMNDRIRSVLYGTKDGQIHYSPVDDYSISDYAYSQMNKTTISQSLKTLCADLLRYGSSAQTYKKYRTDALADSRMTDAHRAYLSDIEQVSFEDNNQVLNDLVNPSITWIGKALDLNSKVSLIFVFNAGEYEGKIEDLILRVSYRDYAGQQRELSVAGAIPYTNTAGRYAFVFDGLLAAELRNVVSVQVCEGKTPVSCTLQYSADTYGNGKTGELGELCKTLFAYSDSAKRYFVK